MANKLINLPATALNLRHVHGFYDDFDKTIVAEDWVATATDSGTALATSVAGGVLALVPSDGTVGDNDEIYVERALETFLFAAGKPIEYETKLEYTEAATNIFNACALLVDAPGANTLVDDGAGIKTSFSGFGFYKVDGSINWSIISSLGSAQTTVELTAANSLDGVAKVAGGGVDQTLRASWNPTGADAASIEYHINGVLVYKILDAPYATSPTEMSFAFGAKNGAITTVDGPLNIDYVWCYQKR